MLNNIFEEHFSTKQCKVCHKEMPDHLNYCPNCGAKQSLFQNAEVIICKKCGGDVANNLERCPHCREMTPSAKVRMVVLRLLLAAVVVIITILFCNILSNILKEEPSRELKNTILNKEETVNAETQETKAENILYEDENFKVSYIDFKDLNMGVTMFHLYLKVENYSDKSVNVFLRDGYANDTSIHFMSGLLYEILPGKNAVCVNSFGYDGLGFDSIDDVEKLEFKVDISDSDTWDTILETDMIELNF